MKNDEVEAFAGFLMSLELPSYESRFRTRFVKHILAERAELVKEEHAELIREYARFDEKGSPIIIQDGDKQMYDVPDRAAFNKEYFKLLNEDFIIDETEERKEMLLLIKEIILNCDKTFKGREALEYDRWCEIVEEIKYE
ncbi:hypothetical protein AAXB25_14610 [Paenibacillus lautus]|uniref:hypothetical protein n=1 Tax=Paenibacillus lautus TaxID=1401 RepID=UPI003D294B73